MPQAEARQHYQQQAREFQRLCHLYRAKEEWQWMAAEMDKETGLPHCLVSVYKHIQAKHDEVLPALDKLDAVDIMKYTKPKQLSPHVDHMCFPQGGVLGLYLDGKCGPQGLLKPLRAIRFIQKGANQSLFSCVCSYGSVYWMGPRLFAQRESEKDILHQPTLLQEGECWVILFRVGVTSN